MLVNGLNDRLQYEADHSKSHWHDLIESRLKEQVIKPERVESKSQQMARERAVAAEIAAMDISGPEKEQIWTKKTSKSARTYYRRLEDLAAPQPG